MSLTSYFSQIKHTYKHRYSWMSSLYFLYFQVQRQVIFRLRNEKVISPSLDWCNIAKPYHCWWRHSTNARHAELRHFSLSIFLSQWFFFLLPKVNQKLIFFPTNPKKIPCWSPCSSEEREELFGSRWNSITSSCGQFTSSKWNFAKELPSNRGGGGGL